MPPTLTEAHDPPHYLERQKAVYVGHVTGDPRVEIPFAYYLHSHDAIFLGDLSDDGFDPIHTLEAETGTMGEAAAAFDNLPEIPTELSDIGQALSDAHNLAQTDVLGVKQAHVWVLRDVYGFSQDDTAKILDIGFSTVSTHLADARDNTQSAIDFVEQYHELTDDDTELRA